MAKIYSLKFGSGDPRTLTGLSPTFLIFVRMTDGQTIAPPGIAESLSGSGVYQFTFGTTQPIAFLADAATVSPGSVGRYITGQIDPSDRADEYGNTLIGFGLSTISLGTTTVAIGQTLQAGQINLGTTLVAIGNTSVALGNTILALTGSGASLAAVIGTTASIIGDSAHDPIDLFGYVKRLAELAQGQEQFVKGSGQLTMFDRTGATTLVTRTVSNNASLVIKS
jgi:hypothetical protein